MAHIKQNTQMKRPQYETSLSSKVQAALSRLRMRRACRWVLSLPQCPLICWHWSVVIATLASDLGKRCSRTVPGLVRVRGG